MQQIQEVGNDINFSHIEQLVYYNPVALLDIKNPKILSAIDNYLPYSVGMEFECFMKSTYNQKSFNYIPNILNVNVDSSEQRYRIPNGLKGLICLYEICNQLVKNSELDLSSSNHYHTDMTDVWDLVNNFDLIYPSIINAGNINIDNNYKNYILNNLKTWNTTRNENSINNWYKFNTLKTLEIRIGEPSFTYNVIVNRLIQCGKITKYIKKQLLATNEEKKLLRLQEELKSLEDKEIIPDKINNLGQIIKNRTQQI